MTLLSTSGNSLSAFSSSSSDGLVLVTPPTSPTTTTSSASLSSPSPSNKKTRKSVCFHDDAKPHDGICERNQLFDCLIAAYFVQQREISELDVLELTGANVGKLAELHEDFVDLVERIEAATDTTSSAPILPRGGGLCMKLSAPHVPYILILDRVVQAALGRATRASARLSLHHY